MVKKSAIENLVFPLKGKYVIMLAPSFVVDFSYPGIIVKLRALGFDKVVELTFGAKIVNHQYHKILKKSKGLKIASVCPGVVELVNKSYPKYKKNIIKIDSPMNAMAKICKKTYKGYKIVFVSPCNFKKIEASRYKEVDYVIDFKELKKLILDFEKEFGKIKTRGIKDQFDKFYNDYTKIYPLAGGLSQSAHIKNILNPCEWKAIDGIDKVNEFLKNPDKKIKFLDANFCNGGCIGGPCINSKYPIVVKKFLVKKYLKKAKKEDIPEIKKGLIKKANGINFKNNY